MPGAHLQGRVHRSWAARRGAHKEAVFQILDVSWRSASDQALRDVSEQSPGRRIMLALQTDVAASTAACLHLRPIRFLQSPPLQVYPNSKPPPPELNFLFYHCIIKFNLQIGN